MTPRRLVIAGVTAAVLLALAIVAGFPLQGGGMQTAEAVVIEGNVSEVGSGAVTISTNDTSRVVRLSSDAVLTDGFGNSVEASKLSAGQDVVLKGNDSGDEFVANQVELRDRLFGVVTALPDDSIHFSSSKGDFVIFVTPQTEFEGRVVVGAFVEVKVARNADGTLVALEVEVEDEEEDEHEEDDDSGGGVTAPVAPTAPVTTQPGSSGSPGSGVTEKREDGGGKVEEDDDEPEDEHDEDDEDEEDHGSGGERSSKDDEEEDDD